MSKILVIGDTHFTNAYPTFDYLDSQFRTINGIVEAHDVSKVIFLGDVFHFRKPDPETITRVQEFFIKLSYDVNSIIIIRGNHDTASKSDEGLLTVLDVLDAKNSNTKVSVVNTPMTGSAGNCAFVFIPHYENENYIKMMLEMWQTWLDDVGEEYPHKFIFGHFGYKGCLNTNGDEDFGLRLDLFRHPTFLGHIHKPIDEGHVHVVGTPYSTCFSESDNKHRYALIDSETGEVEFQDVTFGIRYLQFDYESLQANKEFIKDRMYDTILRVYLNQITDQNSVDLRKKILDEYDVCYVDVKYLPLVDDESHASTFRPKSLAFELDDDFINKYIDECKSLIPKDKLLQGLRLLREA